MSAEITFGLHSAAVIQDNQRAVFWSALVALYAFSAGTVPTPTEITFGQNAAAIAQANQHARFFESGVHLITVVPSDPPLRSWEFVAPQSEPDRAPVLWRAPPPTADLAPELGGAEYLHGTNAQAVAQANQGAAFFKSLALYPTAPPEDPPLRRMWVAEPQFPEQMRPWIKGPYLGESLQYIMRFEGDDQRIERHVDSVFWGGGILPSAEPIVVPPLRGHVFARGQDDPNQPAALFAHHPPASVVVDDPPLRPHWFVRSQDDIQQPAPLVVGAPPDSGDLPPTRPHVYARGEDDTQQPAPLFARHPPPDAIPIVPPLRGHIYARAQDDLNQTAALFAHHPPPTAILGPPPVRPWFGNVVDVPYQPVWFQQVNQALMEAPVPPPLTGRDVGSFHPPYDQRGKYPRREHELQQTKKKPEKKTEKEKAQPQEQREELRVPEIPREIALLPLFVAEPIVEPMAPEELARIAEEEAYVARVIAMLLADD